MHTQVVNTTIKSLEKKNIIKSVKPVKNSIRKVYMLYELEPSSEITGGAWYSGQEFDTAFVDVLAEQCYKFILSRVKMWKRSGKERWRGGGGWVVTLTLMRKIF